MRVVEVIRMPSRDGTAQVESRPEQILSVASRLFGAKGFQATSVDDIAAVVGITGPALYRHFRRKQSILDAVCISGMTTLLERARDIVTAAQPPGETLDALIQMRVAYAFGPHAASFLISRKDAKHLSAAARRKLDSMHDLYWAEWLRVLGNVRPDVDTAEIQVAWHAAHTLIGYSVFNVTANDEHDLEGHLFRMAKAVMLA
jgi:AcrR family transcriptional regulator